MFINPLDYKISELNKAAVKKGSMLLAEPFMQDNYFKRSVVLITEYKQEGVVGFMLNKPLDLNVNAFIEGFSDFEAEVYLGGPVESDSLFYIHNQGNIIDDSLKINDNLYWSGNFEQLKTLVKNQEIFPNEVKFFLGYSGWDYDQLEKELEEDSWIITDAKDYQVKDLNDEMLWHNTLKQLGAKHKILANFPENPSWN